MVFIVVAKNPPNSLDKKNKCTLIHCKIGLIVDKFLFEIAKIVPVFTLKQFDSSDLTVYREGEIFGKSKAFWQAIADGMVHEGIMSVKFGQFRLIDERKGIASQTTIVSAL